MIKTSNPFNYIFPTPTEGLGLNPILQDPALAIHPPVLYLGYVGCSIIFSSVLAATSLKIISTSWASHIKKWILISWIFLTLVLDRTVSILHTCFRNIHKFEPQLIPR